MSFLRNLFWLFAAPIILALVSWPAFMPDKSTRGVWRSDGYGLYFDIGRLVIDVYQVTEVSCMRDMRVPAHLWAIDKLEGARFTNDAGRLKLQVQGTLNPIHADPVASLPSQCDNNTDDSYAVFWHAMNEHYAFFDLHGVDWQTRKQPSGNDLWQAITTAMDGLDDGHLYIHDGTRLHSPASRPDWHEQRHMVRDTTRALVPSGLERIAGSGLDIGRFGDLGYIYLEHMDVEANIGQAPAHAAARYMGQALAQLEDTQGLILDVRYNPGGSDDIAMAYAQAFAAQSADAFTKSTRTADGYTAPFSVSLNAATKPFPGPIVVLTSGFTGSAAEIFTLAMRTLPQVTVVGTPTSGGLSDVLNVTLPNGWELGLSHQRYVAADGNLYEGTGIPPDVTVPVDANAFRSGRDPALEAARARLQ